ncbi:RING finger protein 122 isoform X2 [Camelus ferus]|uniref:RING finger protein 122 isoform X2 n=2 Tax=Camelus TaxID=9836 RepID=A0A8B8S3Q4_CAMFR|nr:RING finger protein 122 isoform X2 [Camelus ferus]
MGGGRSFGGGEYKGGCVRTPCQFRRPWQLTSAPPLLGHSSSAYRAPPPGPAAPRSSPSPGALLAFSPRCFDPGDFLSVCLFSSLSSLLLYNPSRRSPRLRREFDLRRKLAAAPRTGPSCGPASWRAHPACPTRSLPAFVRRRKPAEGSLMHPFQWCNGCFCGLGLVSTNKSCSMPPISFQDLPLNIYMVIFGTGIFVFMLSLIFCCYFISKLRNQAQSERYGYKEQTCAVCLEDFKGKDELGVLPCQHAFHRKCLVKWLEVRCVCPMCNKPIAGPSEAAQSIGILLDELV